MSFSHYHSLVVFLLSLSDSKSPQISRTLLSILADLSNAVVYKISAHPLVYSSSSPFTEHLGTLLNIAIIIDIIVTFMFHIVIVVIIIIIIIIIFCRVFHTRVSWCSSVLLFLLLLFNFQFHFWFFTLLHLVFTQDLACGKVVIIHILCIYIFSAS